MVITKRNTPGRPPVYLKWPEGEFTAKQLAETLTGKLSRVSIHSKIKKDLNSENPELEIVRKVKPRVGRPETVYATIEQQ